MGAGMSAFNVTMDGEYVIGLLTGMAGGLHGAIAAQLTASAEVVKEAMRERAPIGVGGEKGLKGSIGVVTDPVTLTAEIKPSMRYADAVETGSRPHWPPHGPDSSLAAWAKLKGLNVYAVARSISVKGTKPHPYIQPTFDDTKEEVGKTFNAGLALFLRSFAG